MQHTRLFSLLETLDTSEWRRFDRWVHSPWVHQHQDTIRFWELIHAQGLEEAPTAEAAFSHLYPGEPYSDVQMRTLRKYLLRLLLDFLAQESLEQDHWMKTYQGLKALRSTGAERVFERQLRQADKRLTEIETEDADHYLRRYWLEGLKLEYAAQHSPRLLWDSLQGANLALDTHYLAEKLLLMMGAASRQGLTNASPETLPLADLVLHQVAETYEQQPPLIRACYQAYLAMTQADPTPAYRRLRDILQASGHRLARELRINLYLSAINVANALYQRGQESYLREMLDLYREMLAQGLLQTGGLLSVHNYKNIVTLALRLGEYSWTEQFIEDNRIDLPEQTQAGVRHYNLANLRSHQGRYREALRHLQQVEFLDPFYQISYKMLQVKIYYECNEIEALLSLATTFRTFVRRQAKLPQRRKQAYLNFVRFARALFMVKLGRQSSLDGLANEIEAAEALIEKGWLKAKLAQLQPSV
ncbi:MAG: hypothetical protein D6722_18480 [Bacteroidetes bacterium]|nr:MAG: hypothetical protein D6722_18480 [Bacteroidota bacterium]